MYRIEFSFEAAKDALKLKNSEPQAYKKLEKLIEELREHPTTGTGHPKPLSGDRAGQWSRRISDKHRLVYCVDDEKITVLIISTYGHYRDK